MYGYCGVRGIGQVAKLLADTQAGLLCQRLDCKSSANALASVNEIKEKEYLIFQ